MGISTDRVVDLASSSLEHVCCSICHGVLWHPVACATCEHTFCDECLKRWFQRQNSCPNTCEYRQRDRIPHILLQLLSPLKIICKNVKNGCEEILRYEILEKHEQQCEYEMGKCRGCSESMLKNTISEHESACDYVQVTCNNCDVIYRPRDGHDPMTCLRNEMKNQQDLSTALLDIIRHQTEILNNINQKITVMDESKQKIIRFNDIRVNFVCKGGEVNLLYAGLSWRGMYLLVRFADRETNGVNDAFKPNQEAVLLLPGTTCLEITSPYISIFQNPNTTTYQNLNPPSSQCFIVKSIEFFVNDKPGNLVINIYGRRQSNEHFSKSVNLVNGSHIVHLIPTLIQQLEIRIDPSRTGEKVVAINEIIFGSELM